MGWSFKMKERDQTLANQKRVGASFRDKRNYKETKRNHQDLRRNLHVISEFSRSENTFLTSTHDNCLLLHIFHV